MRSSLLSISFETAMVLCICCLASGLMYWSVPSTISTFLGLELQQFSTSSGFMTYQYCFIPWSMPFNLCCFCLTLIFQSFAPQEPRWQCTATAVLPSLTINEFKTNLFVGAWEISSQFDCLIEFSRAKENLKKSSSYLSPDSTKGSYESFTESKVCNRSN
jgi:hypothetical protein